VSEQAILTPIAPAETVNDSQGFHVLHQAEQLIEPFHEPLYSPEDIGMSPTTGNCTVNIVGEISLPVISTDGQPPKILNNRGGDARAAIVRLDRSDGVIMYRLQGLRMLEDGSMRAMSTPGSYLGSQHEGGTKVLGRHGDIKSYRMDDDRLVSAADIWGPGMKYANDVSREQLVLSPEWFGLMLRDTSTNGTKVRTDRPPHVPRDEEEHYVAMHTQLANDLASRRGHLNERGEFFGRKVITRDTTMGGSHPEGTVDIRSWGSKGEAEAIVVDKEKDPEPYETMYRRFASKLGKRPPEQKVLQAIYDAVRETMAYDLDYVNEISAQERARGSEHRKVNLGLYLGAGKGVCRQMALAAAWLGGEAAENGLLAGRLTAEVNQHDENGAHEWGRYTAPDGTVYIIDPTGFFGTLGESVKSGWSYFRKDEKQKYLEDVAAKSGGLLRRFVRKK